MLPGRRVAHRRRRGTVEGFPVHVTWRMTERVWNLRSGRAWARLSKAFREGAMRFGGRLVEFSVQGNHLHLVVEAGGRAELTRAMKGLGVRIARGVNAMMGTGGRVLADRFHEHVLRTPTEVRRALVYVRENRARHAREWGERVARGWSDPFASEGRAELGLAPARTWLLRWGLGERGLRRD